MKLELTILPSGSVTIARPPMQKPPLGLILPSGQDVQVVVGHSCTLATLFSASTPQNVNGIEAHFNGNTYELTPSGWLDQSTATNSDSVTVPPSVLLRNPHAHDIGITW